MEQNSMTDEEREASRRAAMKRAIELVQKYQDDNWRRLRVNDICSDLKRMLRYEAERGEPSVKR